MGNLSSRFHELLRSLHASRKNRRSMHYYLTQLSALEQPVLPQLISVLSDPSPDVRSGGAMAIGKILAYCDTGDDISVAFPVLENPIEDRDGWVKFHSFQALWLLDLHFGYGWLFNSRNVVGLVEDCLKCAGAEVRAAAAYQLACPGTDPDSAIPALIKALDDPEVEVRFAAANALFRFGAASDAMPVLMNWLDRPNPADRFISAAVIMRTDEAYEERLTPILLNSFPQLERRFGPEAACVLSTFGRIACETVPVLARCYRQDASLYERLGDSQENHRFRLGMINAIAGCGFPVEEALHLLTEALADNSREIIGAAMSGLEAWGRHAAIAVPNLLRRLDIESYMGQAEFQKRNEERDHILKGACCLLRAIGAKARAAIPHLLRMIREESPEIASFSRWALGRITKGLARYTFEYHVGRRRIRTTVFGQDLADARKAFRQRLRTIGHLESVEIERCEPKISQRK